MYACLPKENCFFEIFKAKTDTSFTKKCHFVKRIYPFFAKNTEQAKKVSTNKLPLMTVGS